MQNQNSFIYTTYILTTKEKLWEALTNAEHTKQYFFGCAVHADWQEGASITYYRSDGELDVEGVIKTCDPFEKLSYTWHHVEDMEREVPLVVTFKMKEVNDTVKLTLTHENLLSTDISEQEDTFYGLNNGWPAILSNLKTYLEMGRTLSPMDM
ncbi:MULTISPECIES: SRPBCC family protein [Pontibacillus]|uniref:SRPBCC family protein n=1 Tax=Pontibacillus chungwhensis TaxID=265426 RepID=A0ABY8V0N5_9BACI|nr:MULTISPECIES: SRPBCC family protein [Pontibacillus]MCD5322222.1 SRPBCC family protein [Pontibacillus sp. HN14]WIF99516.1 SRPBCC family protein [Pontibacillus chungwhensis]